MLPAPHPSEVRCSGPHQLRLGVSRRRALFLGMKKEAAKLVGFMSQPVVTAGPIGRCHGTKRCIADYLDHPRSTEADTDVVEQRQREGYRIILVGDTNINLHNDKEYTRKWIETMNNTGLINTMGTWLPKIKHDMYTWENGNNK